LILCLYAWFKVHQPVIDSDNVFWFEWSRLSSAFVLDRYGWGCLNRSSVRKPRTTHGNFPLDPPDSENTFGGWELSWPGLLDLQSLLFLQIPQLQAEPSPCILCFASPIKIPPSSKYIGELNPKSAFSPLSTRSPGCNSARIMLFLLHLPLSPRCTSHSPCPTSCRQTQKAQSSWRVLEVEYFLCGVSSEKQRCTLAKGLASVNLEEI